MATGRRRGHPLVSALALVAGGLALFVGLTLLYGRTQLLTGSPLGNRAVAALDQAPVRAAIAQRLTAEVLALAPASGVREASVRVAMDGVVASPSFRSVFANSVTEARDTLLHDGAGSLDVRLERAAALVASALRPVSPDLATAAQAQIAGYALHLSGSSGLARAIRAANAASTLGLVLPPVAAVALLVGIALARRRVLGWAWAGIAVAAAGLLTTLAAIAGRSVLVDSVPADLRAATRAAWDALVGDLRWWGLGAVAAGALLGLVASVGASVRTRVRRRPVRP